MNIYHKSPRRPRSFSPFSGLVIVGIIFIFAVLVINIITGGELTHVDIQGDARQYLHQLGYQVEGLSCAQTDTDNDGYISCTAKLANNPQPFGFECGSGLMASGCRVPKPSTYRW